MFRGLAARPVLFFVSFCLKRLIIFLYLLKVCFYFMKKIISLCLLLALGIYAFAQSDDDYFYTEASTLPLLTMKPLLTALTRMIMDILSGPGQ